jgi:hypothetical protein
VYICHGIDCDPVESAILPVEIEMPTCITTAAGRIADSTGSRSLQSHMCVCASVCVCDTASVTFIVLGFTQQIALRKDLTLRIIVSYTNSIGFDWADFDRSVRPTECHRK